MTLLWQLFNKYKQKQIQKEKLKLEFDEAFTRLGTDLPSHKIMKQLNQFGFSKWGSNLVGVLEIFHSAPLGSPHSFWHFGFPERGSKLVRVLKISHWAPLSSPHRFWHFDFPEWGSNLVGV